MLPSKNDPVRTVLNRLQRWHFLIEQNIKDYLYVENETFMIIMYPLYYQEEKKAQCLPGGGGVLIYKRLMRMCRWMRSHFYDWIDYHGVAIS